MKKLLFLLMTTLVSQLLFSIEIGDLAFINDDHVNVRTGPGLSHPVSFQLHKGENVFICDKTPGKDYGVNGRAAHWYLVRTLDNREGSVYGTLLSSQLEMDLINNVPITLIGADYHAIGTDMYKMDSKLLDNYSLEVSQISDLMDREALAALYQEITDEINSDIEAFEQEQGLSLELSLAREDIKVIEMESKCYVQYTIKYSQDIDPDNEQFSSLFTAEGWTKDHNYNYGITLFREGISVVYPDGTNQPIDSWIRKIEPFKNYRYSEWGEPHYAVVERVTDLDGDDNPEVWYSWTGYESSSNYINFFTENKIYKSATLDGDHYEEGPGNIYYDLPGRVEDN
jgi:hypothetical protein